jgi:hypothetical protein
LPWSRSRFRRHKLEIARPTDASRLAVPRRLQAQAAKGYASEIADRDKVHTASLWAVHGERVDLAVITAVAVRPPYVGHAGSELDAPVAHMPSLALDPNKAPVVV